MCNNLEICSPATILVAVCRNLMYLKGKQSSVYLLILIIIGESSFIHFKLGLLICLKPSTLCIWLGILKGDIIGLKY